MPRSTDELQEIALGFSMPFKLVTLLVAALLLGPAIAQPAAPPAAPAARISVLTANEVVEILDQVSDWYRTLGTQQQFATQPSDLLFIYANRQIADKVVDLAVESARADAELLSSEANAEQRGAADKSSLVSLNSERSRLEAQRRALEQEIAAARQSLAASGKNSKELQAKVGELQGELAMNSAQANLLDTMSEFVSQSSQKSADAEALKAHIDAIAASIPTTSNPTAQTLSPASNGATASLALAANSSIRDKLDSPGGIWDLAANVLRLRNRIQAIDSVDRRTQELTGVFRKFTQAPLDQLRRYSTQSDALATQADTAAGATLQNLRGQFDTLAWLFKQTSSVLLPLSKQAILLEQYRHNLAGWREASQHQYGEALRALGVRLGILLGLLLAVFVLAEVWRRVVVRFVHDPRRRYQMLLVRTILMWTVAIGIIGLSFVTEISTFATFAGLITAGIAVAMQSVLVSLVGYFFLIGKYGIRVGDRVQIGSVVGEVMDLGLVRMHLIEYHAQGPLGPTGRIVAFPNLIVFQATGGLFKETPGVHLAWHELELALPEVADYAALKKELLNAVAAVIDQYKVELERQHGEIQRMAMSAGTVKASPEITLHIVDGRMKALIGYPVDGLHASEIDEKISTAALSTLNSIAAKSNQLAQQ
jgi:Mechanosensitive ion channel